MLEPEFLLEMTSDIVTSMVTNNRVTAEELPGLIGSVHAALAGLGQPQSDEEQALGPEPAVSVRKSLSDPDVIISMLDGKPYKMLTRHIGLHGYTAETYRAAFGLKADYPMVAPNYAEKRRALAKSIGLGRKKAALADQGAPDESANEAKGSEEPMPEGKKPRRMRKPAQKTEKAEPA